MTRLDAINEAYDIAEGKGAAPASGTKRTKLTNLAIRWNRKWQTEPGIEWDSLYKVCGIDPTVGGGLITATDIFTLDTDINFVSQKAQSGNNPVRVKTTDGQYIPFKLVDPAELYRYRNMNAVAYIGNKQVQFSNAFVAGEQAIGGTLQVPAIKKLPDLTSDSSVILIDDPQWLPEIMAAYYVLNDRQLNYLFDDLLAAANERMKGMIANGREIASSSTGVDYFGTMGSVGSLC
jgi:hypothetical protein